MKRAHIYTALALAPILGLVLMANSCDSPTEPRSPFGDFDIQIFVSAANNLITVETTVFNATGDWFAAYSCRPGNMDRARSRNLKAVDFDYSAFCAGRSGPVTVTCLVTADNGPQEAQDERSVDVCVDEGQQSSEGQQSRFGVLAMRERRDFGLPWPAAEAKR